jgi:nucleoside-diphosphate-sugar epimerase
MTRGDQTRDFVYVTDAVAALIALGDCEAAFGQIVNVGSGVESLIKEVAQQAVNLTDAGIELRLGAIPTRPGEAKRYVCSIEKVRSLTGWEPQTGLGEGLGRTLAWWRRRA